MNALTKKEILNYFRLSVRRPTCFWLATKAVFKKRGQVARRLMRCSDLQSRKPEYLSSTQGILSDVKEPSGNGKAWPSFKNKESSSLIHLATRDFNVKGEIPWEHEFEDSEDHEALHRWTWILYKITENKSPETHLWAEDCMMDWISQYGFNPDQSLKWNPYAVSERICNAIIFFTKTDLACDPFIAEGLRVMAYYLANNLEYYGPEDTYNHILNNIRALYAYGIFFKEERFKSLAKCLLENEMPRLITEDGFLREGTSHYHFLITRWLLEIMYFASLDGDSLFVKKFEDCAKRMIQQCHFFLVHDEDENKFSMPLVGDISPDVSPDWLISLSASKLAESFYFDADLKMGARGWAELFDEPLKDVDGLLYQEKKQHLIYEKSGWYRFRCRQMDLFAYMRPQRNFNNRGHFHSDMLSFCLFLKGKPIFIDCGRATYSNNDLGNWGRSAAAHNSILIDGFEPFPPPHSSYLWEIFPKEILNFSLSYNEDDNELRVFLNSGGFRRLGEDPIDLTRYIRISKKENFMEIEDVVKGQKNHYIKSFFHCAPELSVQQTGEDKFHIRGTGISLQISAKNAQGHLVFAGKEGLEGWASFQYGRRQEISSIVFESAEQLPITQTYHISWDYDRKMDVKQN